MPKQPWMKWYPGDWRADPLLRACSPMSRYVWMEILGLMHEAEPYGHLILGGRAMDYRTLSRVIAVEEGDVKRAVKELTDRGVLSRTDRGTIYSRRMIRDAEKAETLRKNGTRGGNPSLKNQELRTLLDNQADIQEDKPQMLEARSQKEEKNANPATTEPYPESLTLHGEGDFKKIGLGSGISDSGSRFNAQRARDEYAATELAKVVGWDVAMAAEDPAAPDHERACRAMRAAAKRAGVGWVSPAFRNRSKEPA